MEKNTGVNDAIEATPVAIASRPATKKTVTNWNGWVKAGLVPTRIICQGYAPVHRRDNGCHSALLMDAHSFERHVDAGHEGGFFIKVRRGEVPWKGWLELGDLGFEIHDLRCSWCDAEVPPHPQYLLKHLMPHKGAQKKLLRNDTFRMTISRDKPLPDIEDAE